MEVLKGMGKIECSREREMALRCWHLLYKDNMTDLARKRFDYKTAEVYFNTKSGNVFLSDEDYTTVMDDGEGNLDLWINLSYHGTEGFKDNLLSDLKNGNVPEEDIKELMDYCTPEEIEEHKEYFKEYLEE